MNSNLNHTIKITGILIAIMFIMFYDIAEAQYGSRHRERRRTAIVVSSETHSQDEQKEQQQQQTQAKDTTKTTQTNQTTQTQQQTTTTTPPPPATTTTGAALAIGTVVTSLPDGCTSKSVDNTEYYNCGPNWYRTAFQGNTLVYVTTDPPK